MTALTRKHLSEADANRCSPTQICLQVIPVDDAGQLHEAFNIRLEELSVIDIKFLYGTRQPTVAVLYQDTKEARHFKTYVVLLKEKVCHADSVGLISTRVAPMRACELCAAECTRPL